MKTLSIRQPWASMIINGFKPVENRPWRATYKGPLLIHAAKAWDGDGEQFILNREESVRLNFHRVLEKAKQLRGGIIGSVIMTGCVTTHKSPWFFGPYGFVFKNPKAMDFFPCPGKLNFFEVDTNAL